MKIVLLGVGILLSGIFVNVKAEQPNKESVANKNLESNVSVLERKIKAAYSKLDFGKDLPLNYGVFKQAYTGYLNIKESGQLKSSKNILSIADYSLSANNKRFWVIDLDHSKILHHTLVAHGQGTGEEFATKFSNTENSHQTSLGFFITEGTYVGSNGYSLKLQGLDKNYNNNAYDRAIVIHGADYVSESFIKSNQRLGRSWGCPALPRNLAVQIIDEIKETTCFFAYYPNQQYLASSKWLKMLPSISDEDRINDQFNNKPTNPKVLLASAENTAPKVKEEKTEIAAPATTIQKPTYGGIILNTPDGTL